MMESTASESVFAVEAMMSGDIVLCSGGVMV